MARLEVAAGGGTSRVALNGIAVALNGTVVVTVVVLLVTALLPALFASPRFGSGGTGVTGASVTGAGAGITRA
jgi:hypothetical protein